MSPQFLLAGLSGSTVSAQACLRVARKAGLTGSVLYRPLLAELSNLTLPCILLLSGNRSCVLTRLIPGAPAGAEEGGAETSGTGQAQAEVIFPETESTSQLVPLDALQEEYTGYALYVAVPGRPQEHVEKLRLAKGKRWFWDVLRYYAPIYRHVALASVIINLIALASPLFAMNVYDRVVPNNAIETLWVLASGVIIIYLFDFLLRALRTHFVDVAGRNADIVLSSNLVDKVLTMRLESKPESTGSLVNNLREFEQLREFFSSSSLLACIDVPFLVIFLLLIAFIAGPMVFLPLAAMPILIGLGLFLQTAARRCAEQSYKQNMQKNALLVEMVNGLETIKACQAESRMQRLWEAVVGLSAKSTAESRRYTAAWP
ncbi:ABC transporter transmembrane domain-containing protein [Desulfovibrio piger]|uniref:ABC transporter transmembrane domain-containing protein n=1 Tax=Desulfovibrio piger TaxID=901 RepID=UPI001FE8358C|nr:ABC transporter transmembrane domain-containing protein [Desulfovibrio piger]